MINKKVKEIIIKAENELKEQFSMIYVNIIQIKYYQHFKKIKYQKYILMKQLDMVMEI